MVNTLEGVGDDATGMPDRYYLEARSHVVPVTFEELAERPWFKRRRQKEISKFLSCVSACVHLFAGVPVQCGK